MMKSLRLSLAFVASIFAGLALPPFASAQLYERILPIDEILYAVVERGFEPISRPQLRGDVYVVDVIDPRGRPSRLSVDAFDGVIIGSLRPRIIEPDRIVREAPLQPFDGRPSGYRGEGLRVFPDGSVRDLRDPSTRSLTDPGSSVRIERVPAPRDSARARQDLPEIAPLPPVRPDRLAARPDVELDPGPARRALPEAARTQQEAAPTPEISERQRSVIERTTPVPRSAPLRSETRAQAPAQQIERAPTPRRDDLLDDVSPDEIDQMDMYPSRSRIR